MKLKEGQKVKVREDLIDSGIYGNDSFENEMSRFRGKLVTVYEVYEELGKFSIEEDQGGYNWTPEMLEDLGLEYRRPVLEEIKRGD